MAPISDTEIVFFRFENKRKNVPVNSKKPMSNVSGGVAIYDVVNNTVTNVAEHPGFKFSGKYGCVKSS